MCSYAKGWPKWGSYRRKTRSSDWCACECPLVCDPSNHLTQPLWHQCSVLSSDIYCPRKALFFAEAVQFIQCCSPSGAVDTGIQRYWHCRAFSHVLDTTVPVDVHFPTSCYRIYNSATLLDSLHSTWPTCTLTNILPDWRHSFPNYRFRRPSLAWLRENQTRSSGYSEKLLKTSAVCVVSWL